MYSLVAKLIAIAYRVFAMIPLQRKIVLLSRQGKEKSLDFRMLEVAMHKSLPDVKVCVCLSDPEAKSRTALVSSLPKMLYHVATARVCVLEGYIPAVSIPNLRPGTRVIQLWHAMGAVKKFGLQSVGTSAGRSMAAAKKLRMHANYDFIVAAAEGAKPAYAEAFGYAESAMRVLGMPRMDYLIDASEESARSRAMRQLSERFDFLNRPVTKVLYAPTMRQANKNWMAAEVGKLADAFSGKDCILVVAGHPLEKDDGSAVAKSNVFYAPGAKAIDLLGLVDLVITDYSAVAFEGFLAKKPVWFYISDAEEYRRSPGLNIDPEVEFSDAAFRDAQLLAERVTCDGCKDCEHGRVNSFDDFCCQYFGSVSVGSTQRVVDLVGTCYRESLKEVCAWSE